MVDAWPRLGQLLAGGAWGPMQAEAIKQALLARALQADHLESKAGSQWSAAIRLCQQSQPDLPVLRADFSCCHWSLV